MHPIAQYLHKIADDAVGNKDPRKMSLGRLTAIAGGATYSGYTGALMGNELTKSVLRNEHINKLIQDKIKVAAYKRALQAAPPEIPDKFNPAILAEQTKLNSAVKKYSKWLGKGVGSTLGALSGLTSTWLLTDPGVRKAITKALDK